MGELVALKRDADPLIVEYLEAVLTEAREGKTTGVLILAQDAEGLRYSIAGITERFEVIGWLSHAIYKLNSEE